MRILIDFFLLIQKDLKGRKDGELNSTYKRWINMNKKNAQCFMKLIYVLIYVQSIRGLFGQIYSNDLIKQFYIINNAFLKISETICSPEIKK